MRTAIRYSVWTLMMSFLVGCDGVVGPDERRQVGVIDFFEQPTVIAVPDTVRAGEDFQVSVRTYGRGCVRQDTTEVAVEGRLAQVVPYDLHSRDGTCSDVVRAFDHAAVVRFEEAGEAEVRVVGKRLPENAMMVLAHPVVVEDI